MTFTDYFIPTIILVITGFALLKKNDIFDAFLEGAKEGISTSLDILPSLICLMTCIGMFKSVGGFGILASFVQPLTDFFGFPSECAPLIFIRPMSGSGALSVYNNIVSQYGADSFIGRVASVMMGSTETTFYTVAVYFGAVKIKNSRYAIPAALVGDMTGWIASVIAVRMLF